MDRGGLRSVGLCSRRPCPRPRPTSGRRVLAGRVMADRVLAGPAERRSRRRRTCRVAGRRRLRGAVPSGRSGRRCSRRRLVPEQRLWGRRRNRREAGRRRLRGAVPAGRSGRGSGRLRSWEAMEQDADNSRGHILGRSRGHIPGHIPGRTLGHILGHNTLDHIRAADSPAGMGRPHIRSRAHIRSHSRSDRPNNRRPWAHRRRAPEESGRAPTEEGSWTSELSARGCQTAPPMGDAASHRAGEWRLNTDRPSWPNRVVRSNTRRYAS